MAEDDFLFSPFKIGNLKNMVYNQWKKAIFKHEIQLIYTEWE